jgi:2-oxoglutarate ferredoxin oxidoreductase subunit gamma
MSMGRLIAYTGMQSGKEVSWLPSYGPEMRGGTANCHVIVADEAIASPVISGNADVVVAMNYPSMRKFEGELNGTPSDAGLLLYNSSLIEDAPSRGGIRVIAVPATDSAAELGNTKVANMVMLGAFLAATALFTRAQLAAALEDVFGSSKEEFLPLNLRALDRGLEIGYAHAAGSDEAEQ